MRWYRNLLSADKMDKMIGPYSVSESLNSSDGAIAPLPTWDNKGTTNLALLGGLYNEIRKYLINKDNVYISFLRYLEQDLQKITTTILGTELTIAGPGDTTCQDGRGSNTLLNINFECQVPVPMLANTRAVQNPAPSAINNSGLAGEYRVTRGTSGPQSPLILVAQLIYKIAIN